MLLSVTACGGGTSGSQSSADDATSITIAKPDGAVGSENNNPFIGDSSAMKLGYANAIYEPLAIVNMVDPTQEIKPILTFLTFVSRAAARPCVVAAAC
ncbi:hypothetical protein [Bifidobacterium callitrichidarum]|uniref:Uncharacterized protein n=1 Tax=Bifidobacterium callitrichidarum TaxID=2052941 RepID=A0A2U2NAY5_9BIFI|nr:hypothetical protein [Bifidobacterium callitrichidarum]PWG66316.1 hypothetical protein DF196_03805 [Bifidobacterium callitrichidarum]